MTQEQLYTPKEAAAYLGVHQKTIIVWITTGKLAAFKLPNGNYRIKHKTINKMLETPAVTEKEAAKAKAKFNKDLKKRHDRAAKKASKKKGAKKKVRRGAL